LSRVSEPSASSLRSPYTPMTANLGATSASTIALAGYPAQSSPPSNVSTITSNFNGTSIAAGDYIWFNSVMKASGVPAAGATITVSGATVQFTANGVAYSLPVPDSVIVFSPSASSSTTGFDAVNNQWQTTVPVSNSGNVFLAGLSEYLASALPGGINPVSWTATFYTNASGVSLQWQWAASVYTSFSASYTAIGVKPIDATSGSAYQNSDHAGTPESYKTFVTGGARGGGGSNWTGSYSGTESVVPKLTTSPAPLAKAGPNQTVPVGTTIQLNGTASSDPEGLRINYDWSFVSTPAGSHAVLSDVANPTPTFLVDLVGNYTLQLIVSDGELTSAPSQVVISTKNSPPVANAGQNQTVSTSATVQLDGSASSDVDGDALTYRWTIVSTPQGSTATLSNPGIVNPTFITDEPGTYVVQLIVNDGTVDSAPSQVTISSTNTAPVANAGPNQTVNVGNLVQLDGSHSTDVDGNSLTYSWAMLNSPDGSSAALSNTTAVQPTFVADRVGTYVLQLIVNDGFVDSQPATVTVSTNDVLPVANAGPNQTVTVGALVALNGSGSSDSDGLPVTYQWALSNTPQGSTATLSSINTAGTSFTADLPGTYIAQLIVNDGFLSSPPATVKISTNDVPPVANPGHDQTVIVGTTVQLDGSASSDSINRPLTFTWAVLTQPAGGTATLSSVNVAKPTFVAALPGLYVIQLIVNDGYLDSQPQTTKITANQPNQPPAVNAGPNQTITLPTNTATLSGAATDDGLPNGTLTIQWSVLTSPAGSAVSFSQPNSVTTQATFSGAGQYTLQLSANDGQYTSTSSTTVTVNQPFANQPPIVSAGPNQSIQAPATSVTLQGSATDDGLPSGVLLVQWSEIAGPGVAAFTTPNSAATSASFTAPGVYLLRLTATDTQLASSSDVTVTVQGTSGVNQAPVVSAGASQVLILPRNSITLQGEASDDGLPSNQLMTSWTQTGGPVTAQIFSPNTPVTQVSFVAAGTYTFQFTASDTQLSTSASVTVVAYPPSGVNQAPYVSAGPDQTVILPNGVLLLGTAVDDGLPNGTLLFGWTQTSGPAPANIGSPNASTTTVTFPQAGEYAFQLSASDSQLASNATVHVHVLTLSGARTNKGTDFWLAFPTNYNFPPQNPTVNISSDAPTSGTVSVPGLSFSQSFTLAAGATTSVTLPPNVLLLNLDPFNTGLYGEDLVQNKGVHITSSLPVTVSGIDLAGQRTDGYLALPTPTLGTDYITLGYRNVSINGGGGSIPTQYGTDFAIVAPYDGTTVTITPSTDTRGRKAGVPYNVILNSGRTYELLNDDTTQANADLSGTLIHSDKPVAVFSGHWCANIGNAGACNELVEQMLPTDEWGQNFAATQFATRTSPYVLHVLASQDATNVSVNGETVSTLNKGGVYEGLFPAPVNVTADKPILVAQYAQSSGVDSPTNTNGDPTMVLLQPLTSYASSYRVFVPTQTLQGVDTSQRTIFYTFQENYANVTIPSSAVNSLAIDGTPVNGGNFVAVPNSSFSAAAIPLSPGPHLLQASVPFGAIIYGFALFDAYSYPAGLSVDSVPTSNLTLSPASQILQTGSQECTAARITDSFGNGMGGIRLGFAAAGANSAQGFATTDFAGITQFCYTGVHPGTDTVSVAAGTNNVTSTVTWQNGMGNQAPFVSAGPAQSITPSKMLTLPGIATDDGLPAGTLSVQWSVVSGPGTVTFSSPNSADTLASFSAAGAYQLQLSASDGQQTSTSVVNISVNTPPQNQAPVVSAGANFTVDLNQQTDGIATLSGSVTDDGLPSGTMPMANWTITTCNIPGAVTCQGPVIFNPTSAVTQVQFPPFQRTSGSYTFQLTGDDTQLTASSQVTVNVIAPIGTPVVNSLSVTPSSPTLPNATVTATATVSDQNLPSGAPFTYQWTQIRGPAQVSFSTPTQISTEVTFPQAGIYGIQIAVSNGAQSGTSTAQITVNPAGQPPSVTASASPGSITLPTNTVTLAGTATQNGQSQPLTYLWAQTSGPSGGATLASPAQLSTTATFTTPGNYNFTFTAYNGALSTTAQLPVTVSPTNQPPVVSAGPSQSISLPNATTTLNGTATDDGKPAGSTLAIVWTQVSGPATVSFGTPTKAVTAATFTAAGTYDLQLSANDSQFTSTSDVIITVTAAPQNQPPTVFAGMNQTIALPSGIFLAGTATDDGLPTGSHLTVQWSEISGPGAVTFGSPASAVTSVAFPVAGQYVLQLSANDTQLTSTSTVNITVLPAPNQPPLVSVGPNQTITLPNTTFTLNGVVTDDGLPVGGTLVQVWTQRIGPTACTFSNPNSAVTQASCPAAGQYFLDLTASDGQLSARNEVIVNVNPAIAPPQVSAGSNQTIQLPTNTVTLSGTAVPGAPGLTLSVLWTQIVGPSTAVIANPNQLATAVAFRSVGNNVGNYEFQLTVTGGGYTATSNVNIVVNPASQPPSAQIFTPADGSEITQPIVVTGSISPVNWVLEYSPNTSDGPSGVWTQFARAGQSSTQVNNTTLGTFDPTTLSNGSYTIRLTATNQYGQPAVSSVTVFVDRNMKVGVLQLAFNDLTVPVPGVPIQIIRSYSSLDRGRIGEFGSGWSLALSSIRLQKNRVLGRSWTETAQTSGFFPQFCLQPNGNPTVTITFPDGKTYAFAAVSAPQCQVAGPITAPTLAFQQLPGTADTAGATLVPVDGGSVLFAGNIPGSGDLTDFNALTYNPTQFILTTADGTQYTIDQNLGLTHLLDRYGNTLTISSSGIVSSTGKNVKFIRDSQNRITEIDDPDGNRLLYTYNGNDLFIFKNATGDQTRFSASEGILSQIFPPGQSTPIQFVFDGSGRLTSSTDQLSGQIQYTHDVNNQVETITDRNGKATVYNYDANGNVIQVTDALNHVTTSTYDGNDNKLTETNALGNTTRYTYDGLGNRTSETDPLGHSTRYAFNALKQPLTITDANGNVTTNSYDSTGNLLATSDALNNVTTNTYTPQGQLATTKDALNHTTSFVYDASGNLQTQTDALLNVTTYTYDSNGNRKTQAVTRTKNDGTHETLTTQYQYDGANRLTKTIAPDGAFTQIQYDPLGRQSATIDALLRTTSYTYDADGRLLQTLYPDQTTESSTYDKNGNRLTSKDRAGHVTTFTYDALNRLTTTTYVDSSSTSTTYDAIGQVLTSKDANGNVTQYAYDDAGRRTSVTDALTHLTTFAYDAAGNQLSVTDANSHATQYVYDANNRRIKVVYPDTKFETTGYDALGRVTSRTDAKGITTNYGYDSLGRFTSVTDALSQVTSYGYDEVGNRITQTDANSHTTKYAYDQRGRRLQRTLPLGQAESYAYDANGNLSSRTDFNGRVTTYGYDNMNRLLSKTADAFFATNHLGAATVGYTYNAVGQRATMADASGTTNYTYGTRNRLMTRATPQGTLSYTYDAAGDVKTIQSSNVNGARVSYGYDALNRLATVTDTNGATSYSYDNVGNLAGFTYPNGVAHAYSYDNRNRLTNLGVAKGGTNLAGYSYLLDASGHRLSVTELTGRTVNYGYDNLYRLTSETIASDPNAVNGSISYTYDPVGNRLQKTSTLPGLPGGLSNYNANDQLATDTYDASGNTTASNGNGYAYDFENHLVQQAGITIVYDGDGNRVAKTTANSTTQFLVDNLNPTGYAQVMDEVQSSGVVRTYTWGLELITEHQTINSTLTTSYYVFDGHGSVRALTNATGTVTDTYDYDAFGNLIHSMGTTPNNYLFAGEQFDPDLGLYYNRARYLNVSTGRFWSMDTDEGRDMAPLSLHKYLYVSASPVNRRDPAGHDELGEVAVAGGISGVEDASAAEADSLALRVLNTLTNRGATARVLGTASSLVPAFKEVETAFEENEGIVVELQDELFAIRYVATEAKADGLWWGTQLFNTTQQAIDALALNPVWGNTAQEIVFGVIPNGARLIVGYAASQGSLSGGAFQILADSQTLISIALME
jgi:RHS repeat-associated protein